MPDIVIIAEQAEGRIQPVTYELAAFASALKGAAASSVQLLVLGQEVAEQARELALNTGYPVLALKVPGLGDYDGEVYRAVLGKCLAGSEATYILAAHTTSGMDYAPSLALKLGAACLTGITGFKGQGANLRFNRPLYGGKLVAELRSTMDMTVLTLQPGVFPSPLANGPAGAVTPLANGPAGAVTIQEMAFQRRVSRALGLSRPEEGSAELSEARVIVAAGRGVGQEENLDLIKKLAGLFPRSAVAGSRPLCDLGWLPYRRQVGQSGATVRPELYFACGISGSAQHVMGMSGSKYVVALNKDPRASIFNQSDLCIVEDLNTFIPALIKLHEEGGF